MLNTAVDEYKLQFDNMCKQSANSAKCVSKYFDENYRQDETKHKTVNKNNYKLIDDTEMKTLNRSIEECDMINPNSQNSSQESIILQSSTEDLENIEDFQKTFRSDLDLRNEIEEYDVIEPNSSQDSGTLLKSSEKDESDDELTQTNIEEKIPFLIEPFFNITPREMPESPHHIVEEEFKNNPWIMLVATIFLTKTSGKVARPLMKIFFEKYPTPLHVIDTEPSHLEEYFVNLGLRKRGTMIWKMSYQFISGKWRRASDLCGIGKYGEDAYRLFCLGHYDIEPTDRYLKLYLDWLKFQTDHTTAWSVADCERIIRDPVAKYYKISLR